MWCRCTPPSGDREQARWRRDARTIAAYRDRYLISDDTPLGPAPQGSAQKIDRARAHAAFNRAQKLAEAEQLEQERARRSESQRLGPTL